MTKILLDSADNDITYLAISDNQKRAMGGTQHSVKQLAHSELISSTAGTQSTVDVSRCIQTLLSVT